MNNSDNTLHPELKWLSGPLFVVPLNDNPGKCPFNIKFRLNADYETNKIKLYRINHGEINIVCNKEHILTPENTEVILYDYSFIFEVDFSQVTADCEIHFKLVIEDFLFFEDIFVRGVFCNFDFSGVEMHGANNCAANMINALLYYSFRRYSSITFIKQYTIGFSGMLMMMARPILKASDIDTNKIIETIWGQPIIIKTGKKNDIRKEYLNYQRYVKECFGNLTVSVQSCLEVCKGNEIKTTDEAEYATIISKYLTSDEQINFSLLKEFILSTTSGDEVIKAIQNTFGVLGKWYGSFQVEPVSDFPKWDSRIPEFILYPGKKSTNNKEQVIQAFFDYRVTFKHRWNKTTSALLDKIKQLKVKYSIIHGDLHTGNVFIDSHINAWVIDFEDTGYGPVLFDFVQLENKIRLWGLRYKPFLINFKEMVIQIEQAMLDALWGVNMNIINLINSVADCFENNRQELFNIFSAIIEIRKQALKYCMGHPLKTDYLSILYLSLCVEMRYARFPEKNPYQNINHLILLIEFIEPVLMKFYNIHPQTLTVEKKEKNIPFGLEFLQGPSYNFLKYFFEQDYAAFYFPQVTRLKGIVQPLYHKSNVFDHTLQAIMHLEELLDKDINDFIVNHGDGLYPLIKEILELYCSNEVYRMILKWAVLFHDTGKIEAWSLGEKGKINFLGHERLSITIAQKFLQQVPVEKNTLKTFKDQLQLNNEHVDEAIKKFICLLIEKHHTNHQQLEPGTKSNLFFDNIINNRNLIEFTENPYTLFVLATGVGIIGIADIKASDGPQAIKYPDLIPKILNLLNETVHLYFKYNPDLQNISKNLLKIDPNGLSPNELKELGTKKNSIINESIENCIKTIHPVSYKKTTEIEKLYDEQLKSLKEKYGWA